MTLLTTKYGVSMYVGDRNWGLVSAQSGCTLEEAVLEKYRPACREVASLDGRKKRERAELLEVKNLKKNSDDCGSKEVQFLFRAGCWEQR